MITSQAAQPTGAAQPIRAAQAMRAAQSARVPSDPSLEPVAVVQRHIEASWLAVQGDDHREAQRRLTEAVRIGEIHGLVDVFVQAGPTILDHLVAVTGPQAAFRDIILARARHTMQPRRDPDLVDPLTERELAILTYLPTRFTNGELAERCYVSVNTIKTHMGHIYRKLDVTNRDEAIDRARVLGLL